ncbi:uncharacterized protein LOC141908933 [Tubulanus polymorphus]|uniref:uncharacterized protein LOC141908933 n=1 Tax=Tubulanus polymorphus TaxID=672921 RepID=UPI003DA4525E
MLAEMRWAMILINISSLVSLMDQLELSTPETNSNGSVCAIDSDCNGHGSCVRSRGGCDCEEFFSGKNCEDVNLLETDYNITPTTVTLKWNKPLNLSEYTIAVWLRFTPQPDVTFINTPVNYTEFIKVDGLYSGNRVYDLCLLRTSQLPLKNETETKLKSLRLANLNKNCLSFATMFDGNDPFTKAAFIILIIIGSLFVILLFTKCILNMRKTRPEFVTDVRLKTKQFLSKRLSSRRSENEWSVPTTPPPSRSTSEATDTTGLPHSYSARTVDSVFS